jgi:hypothetical protein
MSGRDALGAVEVAVRRDDAGAGRGERDGDGPSDAGSGAGDDGLAVSEVHGGAFLLAGVAGC